MNQEQTETLLRFTGDWSAVPVFALALALAAAMFFYYRRELRYHSGVSRWMPAALRALAVFILVLCLSGPVLRRVSTFRQLGRVVIVADASASMNFTDSEGTKPVNQAQKTETRFTRLEQALLKSGALIDQLAEKHDVELFALRGYKAERIWWRRNDGGDTSGELPGSFGFKPEATITNLDSTLRDALGPSPAGTALVLLSDGQHNAAGSPEEFARSLKESNIPIFTVGYGTEAPPADLALLNVIAPEAVFAEDRAEGVLVIQDSLPAGMPATASIVQANKVLWQQTFTTDGSRERRMEFAFPVKDLTGDPKQSMRLLTARLELTAANAGKDKITDNNQRTVAIHLLTRKRKALILDGRPRWETRYLQNHFSRDERWDVKTAFDDFNQGQSKTIQAVFPKKKEDLMTYDLIVLGDLRPDALSEEQQALLGEFVEKRGGGLILVDGARGHLKAWQQTKASSLLPVSWTDRKAPTAPMSYRLTTAGESAEALRLSDTAATNATQWKKLPAAFWCASAKPQPDATVLAELNAQGGEPLPVMVTRRLGAGSVLWLGSDEMWRWRYEVADMHHQRFWMQIGSWIGAPPFLMENERLSIGTDQLRYEEGETAELRVRLRDASGGVVSDAKPRAHVFRNGLEIANLELETDPAHGGVFRAITGALPAGDYQVSISEGSATPGEMKLAFRVESHANQEWSQLTLNRPLLEGMARASGGRFLREGDLSQLPALLQQLDRQETRVRETLLWSSWWWFGAAIALLTAEWLLRKRWRLV